MDSKDKKWIMIHELGSIGIKITGSIKKYAIILKHAIEIFLNYKKYI